MRRVGSRLLRAADWAIGTVLLVPFVLMFAWVLNWYGPWVYEDFEEAYDARKREQVER